jgi:peptide/nickel transport system substrate-binding protein
MNVRNFDRLRRGASGVEVDHIEAFAQGRISRREFVTRGSVLGLSVPFMGAILAACGSSKAAPVATTNAPATTAAAAASTAAPATTAAAAAGAPKPGGTLKVANQRPSGPVDPVAMDNLGAYTVVTIPFEYLCGPGEGAALAPMLAESWKPDATGLVWTFKLRQGVKWHDGTPFTSADVVASLDRLAVAGLKAAIKVGSSRAVDAGTVEITLNAADGQFPYQVSNWNPQSVMTPVAFVKGTTVDKMPNGTGPFKLVKYDATTGASYERNDAWWGGKPILDKVELIFSDSPATQITGLLGGAVDAIVQFPVIGGDAVFAQAAKFNIEGIRGASHRQLWMNTREGNFTDKRTRQAIALGLDRPKLIETVLNGKGDLGNDHPIAPIYDFMDKTQAQRTRDVAKAKQLLTDTGKAGMKLTLNAVNLQEIGKSAEVILGQLKELGLDITLNVESSDTFYDKWCKVYDSKKEPAGCDGGEEFGLVDYGNRAIPDVYLVKAYSTGEWNSAHFVNADFTAAVKSYQSSLDTAGRATAIKKIQVIANEEVPYAIPYFVNSLTAYSKKVVGIKQTGLGHYYLGKAGFVA